MKVGSERDLRIDFFRGLALIMIFVNHVPGNMFEIFTSRNFGLTDAAEIFVFLAGYAAALAYGRGIAEQGAWKGGRRILVRAGQLYRAHILSALAALLVIAFAAWRVGDATYHEWINLGPIFHNTVPALVGLFTLGHQPGYFNILPLYMVLLLLAPVLLLLLVRYGTATMLAASLALYLTVNLLRINLPHYPTTDGWFLNPLAWQLLFATGLALGTKAKAGETVAAPKTWALVLTGGFLAVCLVAVLTDSHHLPVSGPFAFLLVSDKTFLSVPRLLHFLALAWFVAMLTYGSRWFASGWARPLVVLGQQALPVFCVGSVLAIMAQVIRFEAGGGILVDSLLIGCGIVMQLLVAEYFAWRKTTARRTVPGALAAP